MKALGAPEGAIRAMGYAIDELVGIADAESGKNNATLVGFSITIVILEEQQGVEVADINATPAGFHSLDHGQAFRKTGLPVGLAIVVRIFEHEDVVGGFFARECLWVGGRAGHITTTAFIP